MYAKRAFISDWPGFGATIIVCAFIAGSVAAKDQDFTVAYQVTSQGLDLTKPAGTHEFYSRLKHAAEIVCTHGMRVDLVPPSDPQGCYEKALGNAIRSANLPRLTEVYLETHSLGDAATHGIDVLAMMAAK